MFKFMLPTYFNPDPPTDSLEDVVSPPTMPSPQEECLTPEDITVSNIVERVTQIVKENYNDAEKLLAHYFEDKMKEIAYQILDYMSTEDLCEDEVSDETIKEFCKEGLIGFAEVRIDFYDEIEKCYTVDVWRTNDESEEGEVVARVYENKVIFVMDDVNLYLDVMRAIHECKNNF